MKKKSFLPIRRLLVILMVMGAGLSQSVQAQLSETKRDVKTAQPQLIAQLGNESSISAISFSPDGRLLLTSGGGTSVLWDITTGQELRRFLGVPVDYQPFSSDSRFLMTTYSVYKGIDDKRSEYNRQSEFLFDVATGARKRFLAGNSDDFMILVISPDRNLVVTVDQNSSLVRLWDANTGKQLLQFDSALNRSKDQLTEIGVGFSHDSRYIITYVRDDKEKTEYDDGWSTRLWSPETGKEVRRFSGQPEAFAHNGRFLITKKENDLRLWSVDSGKEIKKFEQSLSPTFSPDSRWVAITEDDRRVHVLEPETGKEIGAFEGQYPDFSSDGRLFVITSANIAHVWNLEKGEEVRQFAAEKAEFSLDDRFIVALNSNSDYEEPKVPARLWDIRTGKEALVFDGYPKGVQLVRFSPDNKFVVAASRHANVIRMWETATKREVQQFRGASGVPLSVSISPNGRFLAITERKEDILTTHLWDLKLSREVQRFDGVAITFSPDGRFLVVTRDEEGSSDTEEDDKSFTYIWDTIEGREIKRLDGGRASFSPDNRFFMVGDRKKTSLWDVASWQELKQFKGEGELFLPNSRCLTTHDLKFIYLWNIETGKQVYRFVRNKDSETDDDAYSFDTKEHFIAFSSDGSYGVTKCALYGSARLYDLKTGRLLKVLGAGPVIESATFAPDGRSVLISTSLFPDGAGDTTLCRWSVPMGRELQCYQGLSVPISSVSFLSDGRLILAGSNDGTAHLWDTATGREVRRFVGGSDAEISPDKRFVLTSDNDNIAYLYDLATGKEKQRFVHYGDVRAMAFLPDGHTVVTASSDLTVHLWDTDTGQEQCRLVSFSKGGWMVVASDGHFDADNLDQITGLYWVAHDAPFTPLPPEIFMRDYFQPQLLSKLLKGSALKSVPPLEKLNRVQPQVTIVNVKQAAHSPDRFSVTVEVTEGKGLFLRDGKQEEVKSGAYNLRLFRDGQLAAQYPATDLSVKGFADLQLWRRTNKITLDPQTGKGIYTFNDIRLPQRAEVGQVTFTAYAFNEDRVKSGTTPPYVYKFTSRATSAKRKAYLITVGVDANQSGWNLDFAAKSADGVRQMLRNKLSKEYDVVDVQLLSTLEPDSPRVALKQATKENIHAVLDLLAGRSLDKERPQEISNIEKLQAATPDDLVVLFVSSHGYADPQGNFYVIPYDTGKPAGVSEEILNTCFSQPDQSQTCKSAQAFLDHSISSNDLAEWWAGVDAGEMVMILDSCHSAAVSGGEFRPGPLGDPGFGQLSYDKGMLILTATQPNKTALAALREGVEGSLLSDVLIKLSTARPQQTLEEWLKEAEKQVPKQYQKLYPNVKEEDIQLPVLLDFVRKRQASAQANHRGN